MDKSIEKINASMINHAKDIAEEIEATAVLIYVDIIMPKTNIESLIKESRCIFATRSPEVERELLEMEGTDDRVIHVPYVDLSRLSQIKVATMLAMSNGLITSSDRLVCLSGSPRYHVLDNLRVVDVEREFEVFSSPNLDITDQVKIPYVFDRLLTLALELADEGKEGKPIGAAFIFGDHEKVMELSTQMIINPFAGVPEDQRNILDQDLKETVREFATIDGAFVIRDDGVILAAGRHLKAYTEYSDLPHGLGSRHRSAAGITAITNALAVVISGSTADVRVFSKGKMFMEIERTGRECT